MPFPLHRRYDPPSLQFKIDTYSLAGGIQVKFNGGVTDQPTTQYYEEMAKGQLDVLVEVSYGGPLGGYGMYSYPPVVLFWREDCEGANGEGWFTQWTEDETTGLSPYAIGMPNPERSIDFVEPCPAVAWSGALLKDGYFAVQATGAQTVDVAVVVAKPSETRPTQSVFLDYRMVLGNGFYTPWYSTTVAADARVTLSGDGSLFSKTWPILPTMKDGVYEVRAVAQCAETSATNGRFDSTMTGVIRGRVARTVPTVVDARASWMEVPGAATEDSVTVTFSAPIECDNTVPAASAILYDTGGIKVGNSAPKVTCLGNTLTVSKIADATSVGDMDITRAADAAGNIVDDIRVGFGAKSTRKDVYVVQRGGVAAAVAALDAKVSALGDGGGGRGRGRRARQAIAQGNETSDALTKLDRNLNTKLDKNQLDSRNHLNSRLAEQDGRLAELLTLIRSLAQVNSTKSMPDGEGIAA